MMPVTGYTVEVVCIDGVGNAWYRVNDTRMGLSHPIRGGIRGLAVGVLMAINEYDFKQYEYDRAVASLGHAFDLRRQPRPLRWLRQLLRRLGGEFIYEPEEGG